MINTVEAEVKREDTQEYNMLQCNIEPIIIDGKKYITVTQFAVLTNRSDQSVYKLIKQGNTIRKLRCLRIAGRVLIPMTEISDFPFTGVGANSVERQYNYIKEGEIIDEGKP